MKKMNCCVCQNEEDLHMLCDECRALLRAKRSKNIDIIEKFRADYNDKHGVYKSYGQFVLLLDMIDRRKKEIDNRRKKESAKKIRRNR